MGDLTAKEILIENTKISYFDEGNSDNVVLLIHGMSFKAGFTPLIEQLKNDVRVISCDLPGFGLSEKGDFKCDTAGYIKFLKKFMDTLKIDKFYVFGNSMGGYLSLLIAYNYPESVKGVIARSPFVSYSQLPWFLAHPKLTNTYKKLSENKRILKILVKIFLDEYVRLSKDFTDKYVFDEVRRQQTSPSISLESIKTLLFDLAVSDITQKLPEINTEVLLLWGSEDSVLKIDFAKSISSNLPNCRLKIKQGEKHNLANLDAKSLAIEILEGTKIKSTH